MRSLEDAMMMIAELFYDKRILEEEMSRLQRENTELKSRLESQDEERRPKITND